MIALVLLLSLQASVSSSFIERSPFLTRLGFKIILGAGFFLLSLSFLHTLSSESAKGPSWKGKSADFVKTYDEHQLNMHRIGKECFFQTKIDIFI